MWSSVSDSAAEKVFTKTMLSDCKHYNMIVNFFTRKARGNTKALYVRLILNSKITELRLEYAYTSEKDSKLGYYKKTVETELLNLYNNQIMQHKPTDPHTIKTLYLFKNKVYYLLETYWDYLTNKLKPKLIKQDISAATYQQYDCVYNHLKDFLNTRGMDDINLQRVDAAFIDDFDNFLRQFNAHNTACKNLAKLKCITTYAYKVKRYIPTDPFAQVKLTRKKVQTTFLTETELITLIQKKFVVQRLEQVKDLFLFQCFTGLAYCDMQRLEESWVENDQLIRLNRKKSDEPVIAYMYQMAAFILNKYDKKLPVVSNQKMNAYLKEIADLCGINKSLTTHVARHTYATTVNLNNGVTLEVVQALLGHATIKQTQHYAKLNTRRVMDVCKDNSKTVSQIYGTPTQLRFFDKQNQ